jgi:crotonobetainyl-CoA:carnitine CoA-transferase CaiB-like acyl-CoA transferase
MATYPLDGVRVVDLADEVGEAAARLLADLGADTLKIEPTGGAETRREAPMVDGVSLPFAVRNANKRGLTVDLDIGTGLALARAAVGAADIAFLSTDAAEMLDVHALTETNPGLVIVVCTPFGRTGPRAHWRATDRVLYALSGELSRSGRPGDVPLCPPDGLAQATAAAQAAWSGVVAFTQRLRTGLGQVVDISQHEAVVTGLDPAFGVQGSAAAGRSGKVRRDRPPADSYPIYPCADGYVRLCLLAKRQWRGMFGWLGEPAEFADPAFDSIGARVQAADRLDPMITELFSRHTGKELVAEAAKRGVPLAEVLSLGDALAADHFVSAGTVAKAELAPGMVTTAPIGCIEVDGERLGIRTPSPAPGARGEAPWPEPEAIWPDGDQPVDSLPFAGLKVLDLGVIVFGAELGRAFADLGAEVIKVESLAFPDGLRQTRGGELMNASFAWGQRNKKSLGLNLRSEEGHAIFVDLAKDCDVILSNFKPGTLSALGIGHRALAPLNPGIVILESAAFNSRGPWARRLGYGPLVRAACGISSLWRYDDRAVECWDGVTVFPDHVAARIAALAVASVLIARRTTGRGASIEVAQSDVVLHQLAALAAHESLVPGAAQPRGNRGSAMFGGIFDAAGDDEWCVIDARSVSEVDNLYRLVGAPSRDESTLFAAVADWVSSRAPHHAMEELQDNGVPAAAMLRLPELLDDPQLAHRGTFSRLIHPALDFELPTENAASPYERMPSLPMKPAPAVGQHTRELTRDMLAITDGEYASLLQKGILHEGVAAEQQR